MPQKRNFQHQCWDDGANSKVGPDIIFSGDYDIAAKGRVYCSGDDVPEHHYESAAKGGPTSVDTLEDNTYASIHDGKILSEHQIIEPQKRIETLTIGEGLITETQSKESEVIPDSQEITDPTGSFQEDTEENDSPPAKKLLNVVVVLLLIYGLYKVSA
jgi:hypothetical protein